MGMDNPVKEATSLVDRLVAGAAADAGNVADAAREGLRAMPESWAHARAEAKAGRSGLLYAKVAGVGVGGVLTGLGVTNILAGLTERAEHPAHDGRETRNWTRVFAGAAELSAGAFALYAGLTKPQLGKLVRR